MQPAAPQLDLPASVRAVVFYDGVCGLCNSVVRFLLPRDRSDRLRFATLQGPLAQRLLGTVPEMDSVVVLRLQDTARLERSDAAVGLGRILGGGWGALAAVARIVPRPVRDRLYDWVAANRYRWFGRYDACPLPDPATRYKFLD